MFKLNLQAEIPQFINNLNTRDEYKESVSCKIRRASLFGADMFEIPSPRVQHVQPRILLPAAAILPWRTFFFASTASPDAPSVVAQCYPRATAIVCKYMTYFSTHVPTTAMFTTLESWDGQPLQWFLQVFLKSIVDLHAA